MTTAAQPLAQPPPGEAAGEAARRHLAVATTLNVAGQTAHITFLYYLAPIALREGSIVGRDAVLFSLVAVAMGLAVVPVGRLVDRIPRRYGLRVGLALLGAPFAALLAPPSLPLLALGTISSGAGLAFLFVSFQSYVADLLAARERSAAYGRAGALGIVASAAGPLVAALVLRALPGMGGLRANAALFMAMVAGALALSWTLPSVRRAAHEGGGRGPWREAARAAGPVALLYLLMGAGYGMTQPYFTVYFLDHLHVAREPWGYLLAAGTLASALGSYTAGQLARRYAPTVTAVVGQIGAVLSTALFTLPVGLVVLSFAFLGRSLFSTTTAPGMNALVMQRARPERRAEAMSYASLAWNVGWATGAGVGGVALARLDGAAFPLGASIAFVGVVLAVLLLRRGR